MPKTKEIFPPSKLKLKESNVDAKIAVQTFGGRLLGTTRFRIITAEEAAHVQPRVHGGYIDPDVKN